ncbi:response regulator transcription factor [Novosphingobium flavum]|uniref:Response regulator transcription factor n=1 Tax=Novosphingobium flavum TaxID=1778672 RepID=A0A7X1KL79_9SPHN|nr:response regulator transcription factor [Novosphingobium flavum]MBC2665321.1 response regulator transcription factor [Novosphingobium flavum]
MTPPDQSNQLVLIVDDDDDIRDLLSAQLGRAGFATIGAASLDEARSALDCHPVRVMLLDLSLADGDGMAFCRDLRAEGYSVTIMMLTARDRAADRVEGLEGGADDYLTKPFEPRELIARIRNLLRRGQHRDELTGRFASFGPWRLDLARRRLSGPDERVVILSTTEFAILRRLLESPRLELGREELLPERKETVWFDRSLDNRIARLRAKLARAEGGDGLIVTVRNKGFLLACDVTYV